MERGEGSLSDGCAWHARRLSRLFFMTRLHPSVALIAHLSGHSPGYGFVSSDGRYQAAEVGGGTLIVDLHERRHHRASGVYPRGFEGTALEVEGEETATAYLPAWTDLQRISLDNAPADFWSPWPDPRMAGAAPLAEVQPAEWTSGAPPVTERVRRSAGDWIAWLVALAVLVFFALFGFNAITWALAGGWQWLWLAVGLPVFGVFSVLTVVFVVTTLRERRRVRISLQDLSLERGEGFRVGEPLELRLLGTVPAPQAGERTAAPERIGARLMRQSVRSDPDGGWTWVDECCDETVMTCDHTARAGRVRFAGELCAHAAPGDASQDASAQWSVELHDPAEADGVPFFVARLRLLPARAMDQ